jgi:hypothetical protein
MWEWGAGTVIYNRIVIFNVCALNISSKKYHIKFMSFKLISVCLCASLSLKND